MINGIVILMLSMINSSTLVNRLLLFLMLTTFFICSGQDTTNKYLIGNWKVIESQIDIKAFDDSNISNFHLVESFFQNITFSFSKNGYVKIESEDKVAKPFINDLFNTVLYFNIEENVLSIGSWKKSSNILYIQVKQEDNTLLFNFSGGLLRIKKIDEPVKLKIDKNVLNSIRPLLNNKPLLFEEVKESEELVDNPISTYNCSHLIDKLLQKKCVTMTITKFFNRKFNTEIASDLGLSGRFMNKIRFTINKDGNIINIEAESKNPELSKEIIRTINRLPKFIPAEKNGEPINSKYSFPFIFQVQD
ncbi:hypothetical protein FUA22_14720 [Seonamhaeicola maritimus]|uniref:TonB C-terminal domain-containing protein n=2 Tax=Seonamhaeicola maritimus TaxID=2591822 RepID=A0A5C7GGC4_9FLAO|nr:hypothetical protein FUA22_14720 [Seonamhaeicola maritimus]